MPKPVQFGAVPSTLHSELDGAASVAECISALRSAGLGSAADRMTGLKTWSDEDPDSDPLDIDSVRAATRLLTEGRLPADPVITSDRDGLVYLSWMFGARGALDMLFLPSGLVMFAAILDYSDSERYSVSKTMTPGDAVAAAKPIYEKLFGS